MTDKRKQLGRSSVDNRNRITLVKSVVDILKVKIGDFVYYEVTDKNEVFLQPYGLRRKPNNNPKNNDGDTK